ncbi:MAG: flavodoxin family protein [Lachnospiraceae bacterium]|nr:flavodoxin family protein [Lachnospiraceae bacterium]
MILIVNTTSETAVTKKIKEYTDAAGIETEIFEAGEMDISHCIGCNHCWLKTPGVCAIKDDYEIILKRMIHADQIWVISDTALGFLNHRGKNIYDRILPLATMYLQFKGDQMRHIARYDKRADFGLIYIGDCDRDYLERWNKRVALNFESESLGVFDHKELKEAVACMY